jgi:hypothetical protein
MASLQEPCGSHQVKTNKNPKKKQEQQKQIAKTNTNKPASSVQL